MDPLSIIGLGTGLIGSIGKLFGRGKANKRLEALKAQDPIYPKERLSLAQTLLNARMPGAASIENNIYRNQANQMANINRNATDSSQALALGAAAQGQTNEAFNRLGLNEAQDYQRRQNNLIGAQDAMYSDQVRRYQNLAQLEGAKNQNNQNTWGDISNMGFSLMDFGLAGGIKNRFRANPYGPYAPDPTAGMDDIMARMPYYY